MSNQLKLEYKKKRFVIRNFGVHLCSKIQILLPKLCNVAVKKYLLYNLFLTFSDLVKIINFH